MLQPEQVWLAIEPVDMRLGIDGLSLLVQEALGKAPCDGSAYAFRNKRSNRLKLLLWDGTGVWLIAGVDWQRLSAQPMVHWRV